MLGIAACTRARVIFERRETDLCQHTFSQTKLVRKKYVCNKAYYKGCSIYLGRRGPRGQVSVGAVLRSKESLYRRIRVRGMSMDLVVGAMGNL